MKKILFLINPATNYVEFFYNLSKRIEGKVECVFACESHFPEVRNKCEIENHKKYYFSEYKAHNKSSININEINKKYNLRRGYLPDFDRHNWFGNDKKVDSRADYEIEMLLDFFIKIIKDNNIDFIIYENVSNVFSYCAYISSKVLNKVYIGFIASRLPGRYDIWFDLYGNMKKIAEDFKAYNINSNDSIVEKYYTGVENKKPDYFKSDLKEGKISYLKYYFNKLNLISRYFKYDIKYNDERKKSLQINSAVGMTFRGIRRNISRKIKIKYMNYFKNKFFYKPDFKDNYALYPLHFQPESSTSVNARYFLNQYEVIKNIAFSLPVGMMLYVKDHPHAFGYFTLKFYKRIKEIPNVKLIHSYEDTNILIKNMKLLITLTGTMGYEALMQKKPIITLGKVFYNIHPYCFHINGYEELFKTVNRILNEKYDKFDEYNKKLIYAYAKNTYDGRLVLTNYKKSDMDKTANKLLEVIHGN